MFSTRWLVGRLPKWKQTLQILPLAVREWARDQSAVVAAFVALVILIFPVLFSFLVSLTKLLIVKERLRNVSEFAAASAGRIISQEIVRRANANVANGVFPIPDSLAKRNPERYLRPTDRQEMMNDTAIKKEIFLSTEALAEKNSLNTSDLQIQVTFPLRENLCNGNKGGAVGSEQTVELEIKLNYQDLSILGGQLSRLFSLENRNLNGESIYSVPFCP